MNRTFPRNWLLQASGLLIVGFILGSFLLAQPEPRPASAQEPPPVPAAPAAPDVPGALHTCTPLEISVWDNRVHVQCVESVGSIRYFATATANPAQAARILSTLTAAHLGGRTLQIIYETDDTSGEDFGCLAADCRRIIALSLGQ
jgi:hypothetical protein